MVIFHSNLFGIPGFNDGPISVRLATPRPSTIQASEENSPPCADLLEELPPDDMRIWDGCNSHSPILMSDLRQMIRNVTKIKNNQL